MNTELSDVKEIFDRCASEMKDAEIQLWKRAQEVAIEMHLVRGEIARRYMQQFNLGVNATVAALAQRGIAARTLENSLKIYDEHWKGTLEASLEEIYRRDEGESVTVRKLLGVKSKEETKEPCNHSCGRHCHPEASR